MPLRTKCPQCGKMWTFPPDSLGKKVRCKNCQTVFVVAQDPPTVAREQRCSADTKGPRAWWPWAAGGGTVVVLALVLMRVLGGPGSAEPKGLAENPADRKQKDPEPQEKQGAENRGATVPAPRVAKVQPQTPTAPGPVTILLEGAGDQGLGYEYRRGTEWKPTEARLVLKDLPPGPLDLEFRVREGANVSAILPLRIEVKTLTAEKNKPAYPMLVAFSRDGDQVFAVNGIPSLTDRLPGGPAYTGMSTYGLQVADLKTGQTVRALRLWVNDALILPDHSKVEYLNLAHATFALDRRWLLTSSRKTHVGSGLVEEPRERIQVWDVEGGKATFDFAFPSPLYSPSLAPDSGTIFFAQQNQGLLWHLAKGKELQKLRRKSIFADRESVFLPDGRNLITTNLTTTEILLWDLDKQDAEPRQFAWKLGFAQKYVSRPALSRDGRRLVVGYTNPLPKSSQHNGLAVFDVDSGQEIQRFVRPSESLGCQALFTPDGRHVVCGGGTRIHVWEVETGKLVQSLEIPTSERGSDSVRSLDISPNGRFVAAGIHPSRLLPNGKIRIFDWAAGSEALVIDALCPAPSLAP